MSTRKVSRQIAMILSLAALVSASTAKAQNGEASLEDYEALGATTYASMSNSAFGETLSSSINGLNERINTFSGGVTIGVPVVGLPDLPITLHYTSGRVQSKLANVDNLPEVIHAGLSEGWNSSWFGRLQITRDLRISFVEPDGREYSLVSGFSPDAQAPQGWQGVDDLTQTRTRFTDMSVLKVLGNQRYEITRPDGTVLTLSHRTNDGVTRDNNGKYDWVAASISSFHVTQIVTPGGRVVRISYYGEDTATSIDNSPLPRHVSVIQAGVTEVTLANIYFYPESLAPSGSIPSRVPEDFESSPPIKHRTLRLAAVRYAGPNSQSKTALSDDWLTTIFTYRDTESGLSTLHKVSNVDGTFAFTYRSYDDTWWKRTPFQLRAPGSLGGGTEIKRRLPILSGVSYPHGAASQYVWDGARTGSSIQPYAFRIKYHYRFVGNDPVGQRDAFIARALHYDLASDEDDGNRQYQRTVVESPADNGKTVSTVYDYHPLWKKGHPNSALTGLLARKRVYTGSVWDESADAMASGLSSNLMTSEERGYNAYLFGLAGSTKPATGFESYDQSQTPWYNQDARFKIDTYANTLVTTTTYSEGIDLADRLADYRGFVFRPNFLALPSYAVTTVHDDNGSATDQHRLTRYSLARNTFNFSRAGDDSIRGEASDTYPSYGHHDLFGRGPFVEQFSWTGPLPDDAIMGGDQDCKFTNLSWRGGSYENAYEKGDSRHYYISDEENSPLSENVQYPTNTCEQQRLERSFASSDADSSDFTAVVSQYAAGAELVAKNMNHLVTDTKVFSESGVVLRHTTTRYDGVGGGDGDEHASYPMSVTTANRGARGLPTHVKTVNLEDASKSKETFTAYDDYGRPTHQISAIDTGKYLAVKYGYSTTDRTKFSLTPLEVQVKGSVDQTDYQTVSTQTVNAWNQPTIEYDANNKMRKFKYDSRGRLTKVFEPGDGSTPTREYQYDTIAVAGKKNAVRRTKTTTRGSSVVERYAFTDALDREFLSTMDLGADGIAASLSTTNSGD